MRAGLRERVRASLLVDEAGFTRELEHCYQAAWMEHMHIAPDARQ
jgi:predicted O-linked N-acetylglucosamine transferase (SPINDLY family)